MQTAETHVYEYVSPESIERTQPRGRFYWVLDTVLDGLSKPTKAEVESAMQGHILEQAELLGTYQKGR